jgi:hypothetical protein
MTHSDLFGSKVNIKHRYLQRYLQGQSLYLDKSNPLNEADVILKNHQPDKPVVLIRHK